MDAVFGGHRPATVGIADRLGEGAAGGVLRAVIAAMTVAGAVLPAWSCPPHLAAAGYRALARSPRTALVGGLAGGGSAVALVFTVA
jgi:hypothetical protein